MGVSISISSITQNSQNVANNTSNVTVTLVAKWTYGSWNHLGTANGWLIIDGEKYSFSNVNINPNKTDSGTQTLITKAVDVAHNSDGTKTLACSASFYTGLSKVGTVTTSASKVLTTIPRKSTFTVENGTLGTEQIIYVDRKSTSFTHTIRYTCGSISGTICEKSSAEEVRWNTNTGNVLSLANEFPSGNNVRVYFTLTTYNGNTEIGTFAHAASYFRIPDRIKPSCEISVSDIMGYSNRYGSYVKGLSRLQIQVNPTIAYSSPIKSYSVTANGKTYSSSVVTTDALKGSGVVTVSASVIDTRDRSSDTVSETIEVLDYSVPSITGLVAKRCNQDGSNNPNGEYIQVSFSADIKPLNNRNTAEYILNYKKPTDTDYTSVPLDEINNHYSVVNYVCMPFAADIASSYDIEITASDNHYSVPAATKASTAFVLMHFNADGNGIAFGKVSEKTNAFEFGKDVYINDTLVRAKRCQVGQTSITGQNPWYKFASATAIGLNLDMRISFKVTFSFGKNTRFATLNAYVRTANADGANNVQRLEFESDTGLDQSNFVMAYSGTGAGAVYELWVKLTAYNFCFFEVLSESSRLAYTDKWTLYNQVSAGYAAEPTSGYTQVTATKPYLLNSWPIGSYYIAGNTTSPADLFGGTWQRIEGRFIYGCAASGTVGATGTHTTGSGSSSLPYVNVALWRRTA